MHNAATDALPRGHVTAYEARRSPLQAGHLSALLLSHSSLELRWYAPQAVDPQTPHDRDELYVVVAGTAVFVRAEERAQFGEEPWLGLRGEERLSVKAGDALFVPAGCVHRFDEISQNFGCWMIFYGPEGGERS